MRNRDLFKHFKGTEYCVEYIALPIQNKKQREKYDLIGTAYDCDTPDGCDMVEIDLYVSDEGVVFIDRSEYYVIYQSEKEYETDIYWARKVEDFFGYKKHEDGSMVKRFTSC